MVSTSVSVLSLSMSWRERIEDEREGKGVERDEGREGGGKRIRER